MSRIATAGIAALLIAACAIPAGHSHAASTSAHGTCAAAATDGKGGPYPARKSSICTALKTVDIAIIDDTMMPGAFAPSNVTIKVGTKVVWHWKSTPHNLMPWHSGIVSTVGATFSHTFTKVGTYPYQCTLHSGMNGVLHVVK
jgi:plastocyanin